MPASEPISILLLGNSRRTEFDEARASLDRLGRVSEVRSVDEALAKISSAEFVPTVIVVAQSYPGEFSAESLDRLRREASLARIVGLMGSWCEGEARTGHPWPATIRLYWHQWLPQARRELEDLVGGIASTWSLPSTATDEERLLARPRRRSEKRRGLIVLCTHQHESHDWLATAVAGRGYSTAWLRPGQHACIHGAASAVFDARSGGENDMAELRQLRDTLGKAVPIIALVGFPRIEDHGLALAAGAAAVLSKPILVDDLFWQLDQFV